MTGLIIAVIIVWGYVIFIRRLLHTIVNKISASLIPSLLEEDDSRDSKEEYIC